jgi:hypothetical protein
MEARRKEPGKPREPEKLSDLSFEVCHPRLIEQDDTTALPAVNVETWLNLIRS